MTDGGSRRGYGWPPWNLLDDLGPTPPAQTDPLPARHLAVLELQPPDVLLVGDSVDDADAAADAGAACVLYDGGYHDRGALDAVGVPVVGSLVRALPDPLVDSGSPLAPR